MNIYSGLNDEVFRGNWHLLEGSYIYNVYHIDMDLTFKVKKDKKSTARLIVGYAGTELSLNIISVTARDDDLFVSTYAGHMAIPIGHEKNPGAYSDRIVFPCVSKIALKVYNGIKNKDFLSWTEFADRHTKNLLTDEGAIEIKCMDGRTELFDLRDMRSFDVLDVKLEPDGIVFSLSDKEERLERKYPFMDFDERVFDKVEGLRSKPPEYFALMPFNPKTAKEIYNGLYNDVFSERWVKEGDEQAYYIWVGEYKGVRISRAGRIKYFKFLDRPEAHMIKEMVTSLFKATFYLDKKGQDYIIKAQYN